MTSITSPEPKGMKNPKAGAAPTRSVQAKTLNPRGEPYTYNDYTFPPGEWVTVEERQAMRIALLGWATVRAGEA